MRQDFTCVKENSCRGDVASELHDVSLYTLKHTRIHIQYIYAQHRTAAELTNTAGSANGTNGTVVLYQTG